MAPDYFSILVTAVVAGGGAYFGSYLKKKGENLATHEDVDKLAKQVAVVTETTKRIEADISDRVWDRQARWNFRRDTYVRVLELVGEMMASFANITFLAGRSLTIDDETWRRNNKLVAELARVIGVCRVVLSAEAVEALREFLRKGKDESDFEKKTEFLGQLRDKLVDAARRDLSYEPFQEGSGSR